MAHECPECGVICHCNGDIADLCMNTDETEINCTHYKQCTKELDEEYDNDDRHEYEDDDI